MTFPFCCGIDPMIFYIFIYQFGNFLQNFITKERDNLELFCLVKNFFKLFVLTDFLYKYSICITTSVKGQKYMFQKIKPCKNCCWVKFKLPYNASVLLIDSDLLSIRGIRWTPEKSGFQVASCIAVHSNTFLYDMKAKWYPKNRFRAKTRRWFFGGDLSCFRGTAT